MFFGDFSPFWGNAFPFRRDLAGMKNPEWFLYSFGRDEFFVFPETIRLAEFFSETRLPVSK
jgi:hypothetical protein